MWAELAAFLQANTKQALLISIIGTILVFLYKQFKTMIDNNESEKKKAMQEKLELYTKLELAIASVMHVNNDGSKENLYELLGKCGSYLSKTQRQIIRDYYKQFNPAVLYSLQSFVISEVDKLDRQLSAMKDKHEGGEWFQYMQRLYAPFWPMLLFGVLALYIFLTIKVINQTDLIWVKILIFILAISVFIGLSAGSAAIISMVRREFAKQGVLRWIAIILLVFSPAAAFVFNRIELSAVSILIQVAAMIFIAYSRGPKSVITL